MSRRVLIVDDDPAICEVCQIVLEDEGFEVYTDDGSNMADYVRSRADVILLDIWMQGIDGRTIAKQLKSQPNTGKVVLMSAHSDATPVSVRETGADDFLAKPFELDELITVVKRQVEHD